MIGNLNVQVWNDLHDKPWHTSESVAALGRVVQLGLRGFASASCNSSGIAAFTGMPIGVYSVNVVLTGEERCGENGGTVTITSGGTSVYYSRIIHLPPQVYIVDCPGCISPACRACEIVRLGGIAYIRDGVTYRLANPPAPPPFVSPIPRVAEIKLDGTTFVTVPPFVPLCLSHRRKQDIAVVTFVGGQRGREMYDISRPWIERYAARCQADVIVIPLDKAQQYVFANKWRAGQVFSQYGYERIQWVDADVVVHPDAECLFDVVPEHAIGLRFEQEEYLHVPNPAWYAEEMRELLASQSLPFGLIPSAYNWGMYVASKCHISALTPPSQAFRATHCAEQNWCNYLAARDAFAVYRLPESTHWMHVWDKSHERIDGSQFLHFSGIYDHAKRLQLMRESVAKW